MKYIPAELEIKVRVSRENIHVEIYARGCTLQRVLPIDTERRGSYKKMQAGTSSIRARHVF